MLELTGDGIDDLVLSLEGVPHLVVYEKVDPGFRYLKELVLPFLPGLLVELPGEDGTVAVLHVFDSSLGQVITFRSSHPGSYSLGPEPAFDLLKVMTLDGLREGDVPTNGCRAGTRPACRSVRRTSFRSEPRRIRSRR